MQKPVLTATSLIGMIDTMIISLKLAIMKKDNSIFENIANPILDLVEIDCNAVYYDIPEELFNICVCEMGEAYDIASTNDDDADYDHLPEHELPSKLPRAMQPSYDELATFALETLQHTKTTLQTYLAETNAKKVANMIMLKRLSSYNEDTIGTIATLPNTLIDKIAYHIVQ